MPSGSLLSLSIPSRSAHSHPASLHFAAFHTHVLLNTLSRRHPCTYGPSASQGTFLPQTPSVQIFLCSLSLKCPLRPRFPQGYAGEDLQPYHTGQDADLCMSEEALDTWLHLSRDVWLTQLFISGQRVDFPTAHLDTAQTSWAQSRE